MKRPNEKRKYPKERKELEPIKCGECRKTLLQGIVVEVLVDCPHCGKANLLDNSKKFGKISTT
jgi:phage FluMu protein Com